MTFSVSLLTGTFWGAKLREDAELFKLSENYLMYRAMVKHNLNPKKLKDKKQIVDIQKDVELLNESNSK